MNYYDQELLLAKKALERESYVTLETGIYVDETLLEFDEIFLEDLRIRLIFPISFVLMPKNIKKIKYPSNEAPTVLMTNLDTTVNFGFNSLHDSLQDKELQELTLKFQSAIKSQNPSIYCEKVKNAETTVGKEMSGFDYVSYSLDGRNFNRMVFIRMEKFVVQGVFNCPDRDKMMWENIADQVFTTIQEDIS